MSLNTDEIVVASGGSIYTAVVGTTLPAENTNPLAGLASGFGYASGYVTEDGITFTSSPDVTDIPAFQSLVPVRREVTGQETMLSFQLMQWNEKNLVLAFGGGAVTTAGGFYTYTPPEPEDGLLDLSMIVDWNDGTKNYRLVVPRGNVTEGTETQLQRGASANLSVGFKVLAPATGGAPWYLLTDDDALAVGS